MIIPPAHQKQSLLWLVAVLWIAWGVFLSWEGARGASVRALLCAANVIISWRAASRDYDSAVPQYDLSSPRSIVFMLVPLALLQVWRELRFFAD